jgi:hypothetical protein
VWILRDPWDGRHAKIHQNLGHVPHQNRQSSGLGDAVHLDVLKRPSELDELHHLLTVVLGVESPGLCLRQHRLMQAKVLLPPIEQDLLLPQHLIKVEGVLGAGSVSLNLVEVLFSSSLGLGSFGVEVVTNLGEGFF